MSEELLSHTLQHINDGTDLNAREAEALFDAILDENTDDTLIKEVLIALHQKGETAEEITGAVQSLRSHAVAFPVDDIPNTLIDTCGTGGDGHHTLNISTAVAFVVAGAGTPVVKHGNRAVSSKSGSADVLEALGVKIDASSEVMHKALKEANMCFLLAPLYHPAMKRVKEIRTAIGTPTIFNLLGPLLNPAQVKHQLIGVSKPSLLEVYGKVLRHLGTQFSWVVYGSDGMDEITVSSETVGHEIAYEKARTFTIDPSNLGFSYSTIEQLKGGDANHNAKAMQALFDGERGAYRDAVLINSAAALVVSGKAGNLEDGIRKAAKSIDNDAAKEALEKLIAISNT